MKAYVCVYRHKNPSKNEWTATLEAASRDGLLGEFLGVYRSPDCYYDWGDDPGFFAASKLLGDPAAATWGVCRRNVRSLVEEGDLLVWFCAKQGEDRASWQYFFVGYTTVKETIDRRRLWSDNRYAPYRGFYNVLAQVSRGELRQHETFHAYHDDWKRRAEAPYVIFDPREGLSRLNLGTPLLVGSKASNERTERWRSDKDPRVRQVEQVVFKDFGIRRRLRTTHPQIAHPHIALHRQKPLNGKPSSSLLRELRERLQGFV